MVCGQAHKIFRTSNRTSAYTAYNAKILQQSSAWDIHEHRIHGNHPDTAAFYRNAPQWSCQEMRGGSIAHGLLRCRGSSRRAYTPRKSPRLPRKALPPPRCTNLRTEDCKHWFCGSNNTPRASNQFQHHESCACIYEIGGSYRQQGKQARLVFLLQILFGGGDDGVPLPEKERCLLRLFGRQPTTPARLPSSHRAYISDCGPGANNTGVICCCWCIRI